MDCIIHGVAMNQTRLNNFHFPSFFLLLLKPLSSLTRKKKKKLSSDFFKEGVTATGIHSLLLEVRVESQARVLLEVITG